MKRKSAPQLRALQAQINPHFIFNAMDMVNWLSLSRGCDDIAEIVSSIASLMRYSITDADSMVPVTLSWKISGNLSPSISCATTTVSSCRPTCGERNPRFPKFNLQPLVGERGQTCRPAAGRGSAH